MHQRGPALVRIALFTLVVGAVVLALVQPSMAGTPDSPEVQDATGDVAITGGVADRPAGVPLLGPQDFTEIDIVKAYVSANNTTIKLTLETAAAPSTAATAKYNMTFNITTGATTTARSVQRLGTTVTGPAGVAASVSGNRLNFTFPATSVGVVTGSSLSKLFVSTSLTEDPIMVVPLDNQQGTDTAGPSTVAFVFNGPSPDDTDADGIPDACEMKYFGNSTTAKSNPSEDQDNDTLTLGQECALGTDPTKADSDGDGVDDKKDPFPTDPTRGGTTGGSGSSSTSGSGSRTTSTSRSGTGGSGSSTGGNTDDDSGGEVKNLGDAVEKLQDDVSYLGTSAGGLLAVLILAILALAVRWSL